MSCLVQAFYASVLCRCSGSLTMLHLPQDFHSRYLSCIMDGSDEIFHIAAWEILFYRNPNSFNNHIALPLWGNASYKWTASIRTRTEMQGSDHPTKSTASFLLACTLYFKI